MLLNINEYRRTGRGFHWFHERLPWLARLEPSLYLNKDGSFLRMFGFSGRDPISLDEPAVERIYEALNAEIATLPAGRALWIEAQKRIAAPPAKRGWSNPASEAFGAERLSYYDSGQRFETRRYLSQLWLPPSDAESGADKLLIHEDRHELENYAERHIERFMADSMGTAMAMKRALGRIWPLSDEDGDSYLHSCISPNDQRVLLGTPMFIDNQLPDAEHSGEMKPTLGDVHLRVIGIRGFPPATAESIIDEINALPIEFRWVARWISLGQEESKKRIENIMNTYLFHMLAIKSVIISVITKEDAKTKKTDAVHAADEASEALKDAVTGGICYGHLTSVVVTWHRDRDRADDAANAILAIFRDRRFVCLEEKIFNQEALLGSLPGHPYANPARWLVPSRAFAHMSPVTSVWQGSERNDPIMWARTSGGAPFRFSLQSGGVKHAFLIGQSGNGKSVLIGSIALSSQDDRNAKTIIIERGRSARIATLCSGGQHIDIGKPGAVFQPLAYCDTEEGFAEARAWMESTMDYAGVPITVALRKEIATVLRLVGSRGNVQERTLTLFHALLPPSEAKDALLPFLNGPLDGDRCMDLAARMITIEMSDLMESRNRLFLVPTLMHVFQLVKKLVMSCSGMLIFDEAWRFIMEGAVAGPQLLEGLKEFRKYEWGVLLATQELDDFSRSPYAAAILDNCKTRLFTADPRAQEKEQATQWGAIGIKSHHRDILAHAIPADEYVIDQDGNIGIFSLDLGPLGLALVASNSDADHIEADRILRAYGTADFFNHWMEFKGLRPSPKQEIRYAAE